MLGKLEVEGGGELSAFTDPNERNLVAEVSITEPRVFGKGNPIKVKQTFAQSYSTGNSIYKGAVTLTVEREMEIDCKEASGCYPVPRVPIWCGV